MIATYAMLLFYIHATFLFYFHLRGEDWFLQILVFRSHYVFTDTPLFLRKRVMICFYALAPFTSSLLMQWFFYLDWLICYYLLQLHCIFAVLFIPHCC